VSAGELSQRQLDQIDGSVLFLDKYCMEEYAQQQCKQAMAIEKLLKRVRFLESELALPLEERGKVAELSVGDDVGGQVGDVLRQYGESIMRSVSKKSAPDDPKRTVAEGVGDEINSFGKSLSNYMFGKESVKDPKKPLPSKEQEED